MFPCIQTLGHLGQILQWPRFSNVKDNSEVLLANFHETYTLLEKMIVAATRPFRSKRIHLGMDECSGLGQGRYKQTFKEKEGIEIFLDHLQNVQDICKKHELNSMIWSDSIAHIKIVLFTLANNNSSFSGYYDEKEPPKEKLRSIPSDTNLVYWDYYHVPYNLR